MFCILCSGSLGALCQTSFRDAKGEVLVDILLKLSILVFPKVGVKDLYSSCLYKTVLVVVNVCELDF